MHPDITLDRGSLLRRCSRHASDRVARGDAIAAAFTAQATAALESLGAAPRSLTVREAELYADGVDILKWRDHDARLSVHMGEATIGRAGAGRARVL